MPAGACAAVPGALGTEPPVHTVDYAPPVWLSARLLPAPDDRGRPAYRVAVDAHNPGRVPRDVEYGACAFALWLYRPGDPPNAPAARLDGDYSCPDLGYSAEAAPRRSVALGLDGGDAAALWLPSTVVGDSLPAGRYRVFVSLWRGGAERRCLLPAGEAVPAARGGA